MPSSDVAALADQLLLGRYRVLDVLGEGGFGTVHVCWDPRLMRRVAIKTINLRPQTAPTSRNKRKTAAHQAQDQARKDSLLKAALDETRTASMLGHPNIVQMIDFENDDEHAYIIMEYVEGASLADLLDATEDGLLTLDEAAAVVEGVCDALQFAHENGVLHLDIKPDNIMVDMSGRVRLTDFGMATLSSATGYSGARGGTVGYMPPEQADGAEVDVRTDVFAFACVMYEALTGVRPFAASTAAESRNLVMAGAPDPCALSETVPVRTADVLLDALCADPDMRTSSAELFCTAILPSLGRAKAGRRSLASLVEDVLDDSKAADAGDFDDPYGADPRRGYDPDAGFLSQSNPSLPATLLHALGTICPAAAVTLAVWLLLADPVPAATSFVAVALLGWLAPQLASAIVPAAAGIACIASGHIPLGAATVLVGTVWWVAFGRRGPLRCAGAFTSCIPAASPLPVAPLINGYLLPPAAACATTIQGLFVQASLLQLSGGTLDLAFVVCALLWACASALQGAICREGSKPRCYLGCVLAGIVMAASQLIAARMENEGTWTTLQPEAFAGVLGSTILVILLVFALGSSASLNTDGDLQQIAATHD